MRLGRRANFEVHRCGACSHRFIATPNGEADAGIYGHDYSGFRPDDFFRDSLAAFYRSELALRLPDRARVLDVGCGNGGSLLVARDVGYDARGIDISKDAVALCRSQGLDAVAGNFPTHDFGETRFDLVTYWDVLEHLDDPISFLKRAAALLAPEGAVLVKVPGHAFVSVEIAAWVPRLAGAVLQAPAHVQLFTHESLSKALSASGLRRVQWLPCPRLRTPSTGGSVKRRIARSVVGAIQTLSGDGGLLAFAQR